LFLVDTSGQALLRHEELIGLNTYLAHVAACVDLARRSGFPSLSLVYGEAVSGGYLSLGLMADRAYALGEAQIRVMDLKAMARVTKIAHEQLVALSAQSPVFAPGAENYARMGALTAIWPRPSAALLDAALAELLRNADAATVDRRLDDGYARGGRLLAAPVVAAVARSA
jgi:malonate decarboxylase gamma subunit